MNEFFRHQVLNIQGVDITLFRSNRAKNLNITIKPFMGVLVSVPYSLSFKKAKEVTEQRINWIKSHLSKMKKAEDMLTLFNLDTKFQTRAHHLDIKASDTDKVRSIVRNNKISIKIPYSNKMEDAKVQIEIRKAIERAWRKEAKGYLPLRVKELAEKYKFKYKNVAIKNAKTRWGSCSFINNINLSLHLMRLPDHLIDYVILHELVHTKIKNHSRDFWQLLDIVSGNAKKLDREVKEYKIQIY
jgi:predicted metal-dependent hydrolase|tara:strand:- start:1798 stop:2526 length:729 start_codon:yes stop_codon:yes gene_type:complete